MEKFRKTKTYKKFGYFYLVFIIQSAMIIAMVSICESFNFFNFHIETACSYFLEHFFGWFGLICTVIFIITFYTVYNEAKKEPITKGGVLADFGYIAMLIIIFMSFYNLARNIYIVTSGPSSYCEEYECDFLNNNLPYIIKKLDKNFTVEQFYNEFKNVDSVLRSVMYYTENYGKVIDFEYKYMPIARPYELKVLYKYDDTLFKFKFTKPDFFVKEKIGREVIIFKKNTDNGQTCDIEKKNCYIYPYSNDFCRLYYDNNKNIIPSN